MAVFVKFRPAAGSHIQVAAPLADNADEPPEHIVTAPLMATVGVMVTVTV